MLATLLPFAFKLNIKLHKIPQPLKSILAKLKGQIHLFTMYLIFFLTKQHLP